MGTASGFRILSTDSSKVIAKREQSASTTTTTDTTHHHVPVRHMGGIAIVEMLYRSNVIALVGGGTHPAFPNNKVMIWDDAREKNIIEMEFPSPVKAVKLTRHRIIVALLNKVFVYTLSAKPSRLYTFDTIDNEQGLLAVSPYPAHLLQPNTTSDTKLANNTNISSSMYTALVAIPGRTKGQVQVLQLRIPMTSSLDSATTTSDTPQTLPSVSIIAAHTSPLAALAVSDQGHLIATASETGTLIRIYESKSGRLVNELRRGADRAIIYCIAFNPLATRVLVASDKHTVHVFNLFNTDKSSNRNSGKRISSNGIVIQPRPHSHGPLSSSPSLRSYVRNESLTRLPAFSSSNSNINSISSVGRLGTAPPPLPARGSISGTYAGSNESGRYGQQRPSSQQSPIRSSNRSSALSFLSSYIPIPVVGSYLTSEWSFAQFTLPLERKTIVAFVPKKSITVSPRNNSSSAVPSSGGFGEDEHTSIVALSADGSMYRFTFDPLLGGECSRERYVRFFRGIHAGSSVYDVGPGGVGGDEDWEEED
ncbi:hypothetical protein SeLEV6574_g00875 [Synchytrium endobioticum]|nr:hypothetical protein SeLEV6574_g00875 [Synchytrium endobioticum]